MNQDIYYVTNGTFSEFAKYIKKTDVQLFSFPLLDTSALSILDLSTSFENYKVGVTKNRVIYEEHA